MPARTRAASKRAALARKFFIERGFREPFSRDQFVDSRDKSLTTFDESMPMFYCAGLWNRVDLLDWLMQEELCVIEDLKERYVSRRTLLYAATKKGLLDVVRWLYSKIGDSSFHVCNDDGKSPTYNAKGQVLKFLILNANPDANYMEKRHRNDRSLGYFSINHPNISAEERLLIRRWALLALDAQPPPTGKQRRMLVWAVAETRVIKCDRQGRPLVWRRRLAHRERGPRTADEEWDSEEDGEEEEEDDDNSFQPVRWRVAKDAVIVKLDEESRARETDPLMRIFLPPPAHDWKYRRNNI